MSEIQEIIDSEDVEEYWENPWNEKTQHCFIFKSEIEVIHNQLLREIRNAGYEVYAFGTNLEDHPDKITATFVEWEKEFVTCGCGAEKPDGFYPW